SGDPNNEKGQTLGAILGPWVGTIIGYYFGERPVTSLLHSVRSLTDYVDWSKYKLERNDKTVNEARIYLRSSYNDIYNLLNR
ncbi:MAG: hypothetical protein ACRD8Z_25010, partial [Nitrososphaeraceae archaeon]